MKLLNCKCSERCGEVAPLLLRLVVGAIFIIHGYQKLFGGLEGFEGFLASLGVPLVGAVALMVAILEFFGGIALVFGLLTHWVSKLLAIDMFFAIVLVHLKNGFSVANGGYEFVLLLLATTLSLMVTGAGKWSLDEKMSNHKAQSEQSVD
jgi:putative oxidoreductase